MKKTLTAALTAMLMLTSVTALPAYADGADLLEQFDEIGMYWDITEDPVSGDAYYADFNWYMTKYVLAVTTEEGLPVEELTQMWDIESITEWKDYEFRIMSNTIITPETLLDTDKIYQEYGENARVFIILTDNKKRVNSVCRRLQHHYPTVLETAQLECKQHGRCEWTGDYEIVMYTGDAYVDLRKNPEKIELDPNNLLRVSYDMYRTISPEIYDALQPSRDAFFQWENAYNIWFSDPTNRGLTGAALRESLAEYGLKTPGAMLVDAVATAREVYQEHAEDLSILRPTFNRCTFAITFQTLKEWTSEKLGDADGSGTVNSSDASEILRLSAKVGVGEAELTDEQQQYADVNGDLKVNAKDAAVILQYSAAKGTGAASSLRDYCAARENWDPSLYY